MEELTAEKSLVLDDINNRLFFRLFQAANTLHTKGTQALEPLGVTTGKWSVLGALSRPAAKEGMSIGELSRYLLVSRQHLAGVLTRLEEEQVIERVTGVEDRRSRKIHITAKGEALWLAMAQPIRKFYAGALKGFSFDDRLELVHYITRLQKNMAQL